MADHVSTTLPAMSSMALPGQSPDERIRAAIVELKSALAEKHPGWRISTDAGTQFVFDGANDTKRPSQTVILIDAQEPGLSAMRATWRNEYL